MTGHPLIVNKRHVPLEQITKSLDKAHTVGNPSILGLTPDDVTHWYGKPTVTPNIYRVRVCQRCHCVYFTYNNQTFLCGRLRHAVHYPDEKPGLDAVHAALYGRNHRSISRGSMPITKTCSKGRNTLAKAMLPELIEDKFAPTDMWDCFNFTQDHIKEIW